MLKPTAFAVIGLSLLVTTAPLGGCKKGLSEEDIRRLVRDEVQEQLRERKRRQAAQRPGPVPPKTGQPSRPTTPAASDTDTESGRVDRLRRRVQTLEKLVARFSETPGVSKDRVQVMKRQLRKMRERLAQAEGKAPSLTPSPADPPVGVTLTRKDWRDALTAGIRKLGPQRWQVDRRILTSLQKSPSLADDDATLVPHKEGGKVRGLKLGRVHPKGLFAALGLKKGDLIERLNNSVLTDIKQACAAYVGLSKVHLVTVLVRRAGRRIIHVYTIK